MGKQFKLSWPKMPKISTVIEIIITGINNSGHRKLDNTNSGRKSLKTQSLHCHRNRITTYLHSSAAKFFKKIDLAMKLKKDELKEQKSKPKQVNEITEENLMQAFGISEDHINKATSILERSESTENSEYSSA